MSREAFRPADPTTPPMPPNPVPADAPRSAAAEARADLAAWGSIYFDESAPAFLKDLAAFEAAVRAECAEQVALRRQPDIWVGELPDSPEAEVERLTAENAALHEQIVTLQSLYANATANWEQAERRATPQPVPDEQREADAKEADAWGERAIDDGLSPMLWRRLASYARQSASREVTEDGKRLDWLSRNPPDKDMRPMTSISREQIDGRMRETAALAAGEGKS